jgi:glycosyltransferase involved in cell wall biosynthesis
MRTSESTASDGTAIWYLITALSVGGTEHTLIDLVNGLDRSRYDVTIWTIFEQNPLAADLDDDIRVRSLGAQGVTPSDRNEYVQRARDPFDYVRAPLRFLRAVRAEQPSVLQSFLLYDNVIARIAGTVSPNTTVVTGVREVPKSQGIAKALLDRVTTPLSDLIVSNSMAGAEFAADRGASPERIAVIRNGRRTGAYSDVASNDLRDELDVSVDGPIVGTVGRLVERKGHRDLLSAWPGIRRRHPDARLLIVGDGPERDSLTRHAAELGCRDSVRFLGVRDDVPELLDLIDLFVFPSHYEGLPGALLEAMAAGLPIVTTPVDGNAELVTNYETGLHVSVRAPSEIEWAVVRLLENPSLSASLGDAAGARARAEFTVDRMVDEFERFYDRLV